MICSDQEILDAFHSDRDFAARLLYTCYYDTFTKWLMSRYKAQFNEVDETFQKTIVVVYENVIQGKYSKQDSLFKTYFNQVGKFTYFDYLKKRRRFDDFSFERYVKYDDSEEVIASKKDFEKKLALVEETLKSISPTCYKLMQLFFYQKKRWKDIASILSYKDENSVKNSWLKCKKKVKERLS